MPKHHGVLSIIIVATVLFSTANVSEAAEPLCYNFETVVGGCKVYGNNAAKSKLSISRQCSHNGKGSLKVSTAGAANAEGLLLGLKTTPYHNYNLSLWCRGSGTVTMNINRNGGDAKTLPVSLSDTWQKLTLSFYSDCPAVAFFCATTGPAPQKVVFFIDEFRLERCGPASNEEAEVEGFLIEAEDFNANIGTMAKIKKSPEANGGAYVEGRRYYWLAKGVPYVPSTTKPFYVYLRCRSDSATPVRMALMRKLDGHADETIKATALPAGNGWQWLRTGPYSSDIGKKFSISSSANDAKTLIALDSMLISTAEKLTP